MTFVCFQNKWDNPQVLLGLNKIVHEIRPLCKILARAEKRFARENFLNTLLYRLARCIKSPS